MTPGTFEQQALAKSFQIVASTFNNIPIQQHYTFGGSPFSDQLLDEATASLNGPASHISENEWYDYHMSAQEPYIAPGGSVKDCRSDHVPSDTPILSCSFHDRAWCPARDPLGLTPDDRNFFLQGQGRVTVLTGPQDPARPTCKRRMWTIYPSLTLIMWKVQGVKHLYTWRVCKQYDTLV